MRELIIDYTGLADEFLRIMEATPFCNGSMWIYPDEPDENNRKLCAFAYAAASTGKVTIEDRGGHSLVRLVT